MARRKTMRAIVLLFVIIVALLVLTGILVPFLSSESVRAYVESLGPWGPFALIGYTVVGHIIAPLAGTPALLVGTTVFGIKATMLYIYLGSMISAVINFWISRRFGRGLVQRLVGERTLAHIDEIVAVAGAGILAVLRVFASAIFEEVSYASGLTNMRFRTYMTVTIIASAIPHIAIALIFSRTDFSNGLNVALFLLGLVAAGALTSIAVQRVVQRRRSRGRVLSAGAQKDDASDTPTLPL